MAVDNVGIIGAGSFGISIASLAANNKNVLIYSRRKEVIDAINQSQKVNGLQLPDNVEGTHDLKRLCGECTLLMPILPSEHFRATIKSLAPYLSPKNIIIHGTKGLDFENLTDYTRKDSLSRKEIHTMSEVIEQETNVVRIGCLAGPNLSNEILNNKPTATVISSPFDEVIKLGSEALKTENFYIFSSNELKGTEIVGAFKNIFAIAAGVLEGLDLGKNVFGLLITRAMREMINYLSILGVDKSPALGSAGIGDLVTTASSKDSRNFKFGLKIASGHTIEEILNTNTELAEGVRTLKAAYLLSNHYKIDVPITKLLYQVIYENLDIQRVIKFMMSYPFQEDVDFL